MIHADIKQKGFFWNQLEEMKPNLRGNGVLLESAAIHWAGLLDMRLKGCTIWYMSPWPIAG